MGLTGTLKLSVTTDGDRQTVMVSLDNKGCGDEARKSILPVKLVGTWKELDEGFFDQITAPMQEVSGLQVNMEKHLKSVEEAKKASAMAKKPAEKPKEEPKKAQLPAPAKPADQPRKQASIFDMLEEDSDLERDTLPAEEQTDSESDESEE